MISEQKNWLKFSDPRISTVIMDWWGSLDENRGDRAELRRCKTPEDVIFLPAYHRLRKALSAYGEINDQALCLVAGVLSHVRKHEGSEKFAVQLAQKPPGKESPLMNELRFRKFISIRDSTILFKEAIRAVRLLDSTANIPDLARGLYHWTQETRKQWASDYYEKIV